MRRFVSARVVQSVASTHLNSTHSLTLGYVQDKLKGCCVSSVSFLLFYGSRVPRNKSQMEKVADTCGDGRIVLRPRYRAAVSCLPPALCYLCKHTIFTFVLLGQNQCTELHRALCVNDTTSDADQVYSSSISSTERQAKLWIPGSASNKQRDCQQKRRDKSEFLTLLLERHVWSAPLQICVDHVRVNSPSAGPFHCSDQTACSFKPHSNGRCTTTWLVLSSRENHADVHGFVSSDKFDPISRVDLSHVHSPLPPNSASAPTLSRINGNDLCAGEVDVAARMSSLNCLRVHFDWAARRCLRQMDTIIVQSCSTIQRERNLWFP